MEDLLQCPICYINYDMKELVPRQLPCQHILCAKCLPFMLKQKPGETPYIECPTCKTVHNKTLEEIPRSLLTIQLLDAMGSRRQSEASNGPPAQPEPVSPTPGRWPGASNILTPIPAASAPLTPTTPTPRHLNQPMPLSTMPNNTYANTNPFFSNDDPFDINYLTNVQKNNNNSHHAPAPRPPQPPQPQQPQQPPTAPAMPSRPSPPKSYNYEAPPSYDVSMNQNNRYHHQQSHSASPNSSNHHNSQYNSHHSSTPTPHSSSSHNNNNHRNSQPNNHAWDTRSFLRKIFDEMDINRDGAITSVELQAALKKGQASSEFNIKTIDILIDKYDKNGDREITFDEFYDLFTQLNDEFENFLLMDADGSGSIDITEFSEALRKRGYNFSDKFYKHLFDEIRKKTGHQGILFDNYIRVAARFDYLCRFYRITPYYQKISLEAYLKKTFFQNFW